MQADLCHCCSHNGIKRFSHDMTHCLSIYNPKSFCNWAMSWQNLLLPYADKKGADPPVHPQSLISAFVVRYLGSTIAILAKSKISRLQQVSVSEQAGLSLTWSKTPKTGFLVTRLYYYKLLDMVKFWGSVKFQSYCHGSDNIVILIPQIVAHRQNLW